MDSTGFVLNSWGPPPTNAAPPAQAPANAGGLAASPVAIPPAPPGVNVPEFRKEQGKMLADEDKDLREKAIGSMQFLALSPAAKDLYRNSPDVFGPWVGTDTYNSYVRAPAAALGSSDAQANMEKFNQVQSATKELASMGLKARYGARVTNVDVAQNNSMFGGLQSASADSAIQSLERMEREHAQTLQAAVDRGLIDPSRVPLQIVESGIKTGQLDPRRFLPVVTNPDDAARLPRRSLFVRQSDGQVMRVP